MKNRKILCTAILSLVACFAFSPQTRAACDSPDPGCPGSNLAEGKVALGALTSGSYNTGIGVQSLQSLTDGNFNTAVGAGSLLSNTGLGNTAVGAGALLSNTSAGGNTAVGEFALFKYNGVGAFSGSNTAVGASALFNATTGNFNTAVGEGALSSLDTGLTNIAIGIGAGNHITAGSGNVFIGVTGSGDESNHTYIRNIKDISVSGGGTDTVTVNLTTGLLGHLSSSRRYKENIKPMKDASDMLYRLKPVTYSYKKEIDRNQSPAFGLIAEEVAEVNPNLVARNSQGQPESVHYEMVTAILLNEFLKEHKKVEQLGGNVASLAATVKEQAAQIQKVSAQLEVNRPAPQVVTSRP